MPATARTSRSTAEAARGRRSAKAIVAGGFTDRLRHWGRWALTLFGGVVAGAGLVLHGQVALAHVMRQEVANTFFLWRAVGEATIFLQGGDVRFAFALREVPAEVLRESDIAAWTLVAVGCLVAIAALLLPGAHQRRSAE